MSVTHQQVYDALIDQIGTAMMSAMEQGLKSAEIVTVATRSMIESASQAHSSSTPTDSPAGSPSPKLMGTRLLIVDKPGMWAITVIEKSP